MFLFWVTGYFTSGEAFEKCARSGNQFFLLCFAGRQASLDRTLVRVRCSHVGRDSKILCAEGLMQAVFADSGSIGDKQRLAFEHPTTLSTLCTAIVNYII